MMFKKRQQQRDEFMSHIRTIYNDDTLNLSDNLKKALIKCAQGIEAGDKLNFLAYHLYPAVINELTRIDFKPSTQLINFKYYLEKKKWSYSISISLIKLRF